MIARTETSLNIRTCVSEAAARRLTARYGTRLQSLVLTGSLARGEATVRRSGIGRRVLGDAEFLAILRPGSAAPSRAALHEDCQTIETILETSGLRCKVGLDAAFPSYLTRMKPHVFGFELRECGRVIWGDPDVLRLIPPFTSNQLPAEEAWQILMNRSIELLAAIVRPDADPAYATAKLYLDMATSFLIFQRAYSPTYRGRLENLLRLLSEGAPAPFPLPDFTVRVAAALRYKTGDADAEPSLAPWTDAIGSAHQLWRWELSQLTGCGPACPDRLLMETWLRRQPAGDRARGWIGLMRRWQRTARDWTPRLGAHIFQASPRMWTYAAASSVLFGAPLTDGGGPPEWRPWEPGRLPLRQPPEKSDASAWLRAARGVVWNYEQALWGTTA